MPVAAALPLSIVLKLDGVPISFAKTNLTGYAPVINELETDSDVQPGQQGIIKGAARFPIPASGVQSAGWGGGRLCMRVRSGKTRLCRLAARVAFFPACHATRQGCVPVDICATERRRA